LRSTPNRRKRSGNQNVLKRKGRTSPVLGEKMVRAQEGNGFRLCTVLCKGKRGKRAYREWPVRGRPPPTDKGKKTPLAETRRTEKICAIGDVLRGKRRTAAVFSNRKGK